jgi:gamma-glutamyltranspeptidase / glutathione hydrolase
MVMKRRVLVTWLLVCTVLLATVAPAAEILAATGGNVRYRDAVQSAHGVVASVHPLAAQTGVAVLDAGGNAVDAAVAAVFAAGVVRPDMCGIGGGGFLLHRSATGQVAALDFRESAPAAHVHHGSVDGAGDWGYVTGHNRVGVPGTVAGLHTAWRRLGTRPWATLVEPARTLAADGFAVSPHLSQQMAVHSERLRLYPESASTYLIGGVVPHPPGSVLRQPGYAATLERVRDGGPKAFYRGPVAESIAGAMATSGPAPDQGYLTLTDLKEYKAIWREPLVGSYRGLDVIAMPAPTSGGLATIQVLNLLEGYDVTGWGRASADYLHHLAEAQKLAWADRNAFVADPDFADVPSDMMTSKSYAASRRPEIDPAVARDHYEPGEPVAWAPDESNAGVDTTHISVVDRHGNTVAVTCSLEAAFGSAVVAPGTGFLLNGQLADFGTGVNAPEGGKRPRSSISPTIVVDDGVPILVTGARGGAAIPMAVVQQIVGMRDFGMTIAQAADAERADARTCEDGGGPLVLCLDFARVDPDVQVDLTLRGHVLGYPACAFLVAAGYHCDPAYHAFAEVQSAGIDPATRLRMAVSDPRGDWGSAGQEVRERD